MKLTDTSGTIGRLLTFEAAFLAAYLWAMTSAVGSGAAFWPPDAILLAALLLDRPERAGWYMLATLPVRFLVRPEGTPPDWFLLVAFAGDSLKALLSATLLRRVLTRPPNIDTVRDFLWLVLVAGIVSPMLSASVGATARTFLGNPFWATWSRWFLGNVLAAVILLPALLFLAGRRIYRPVPRPVEFVALAGSTLGASWLIFSDVAAGTTYMPLFLFLPVPLLFWAMVRVGPAGSSLALAAVTAFAITGANAGRGPFAQYAHAVNLAAVQLFLLLLSLSVTTMALLLDERQNGHLAIERGRRELEAQNAELRSLAGHLIAAQEAERQRIARDFNDHLSQDLALLGLQIEQLWRSSSLNMTEDLRRLSKRTCDMAGDVHRLSHHLHPQNLELLGLARATRSLCTDVARRHDLYVDFRERGVPKEMPSELALCCFRIVQESLQNVAKHSGSAEASVRLSASSGKLHLHIADLGKGCATPCCTNGGHGLVSMRERVRFLGGTMSVRSTPERGTRVAVHLPLRPQTPIQRSVMIVAPEQLAVAPSTIQ